MADSPPTDPLDTFVVAGALDVVVVAAAARGAVATLCGSLAQAESTTTTPSVITLALTFGTPLFG
jgi:hypothetical protein